MDGPLDAESWTLLGQLVDEMALGSHALPPDSVEPFAAELLGRHLGATDVVLLLQDYDQLRLFPVRAQEAEDREGVSLDGTLAGRAFTTSTQMTAAGDVPGTVRIWQPLINGTERLGVLGMTLPGRSVETLDERLTTVVWRACTLLSEVLQSKSPYTDVYFRARRRKDLALAAEMQWGLLPPLTLVTPRVALAGVLEPAYDVGGDAYDYALDGDQLHFAIVDAMGHGTRASIMSTVAVGAYRNARRRGESLAACYAAVDEAMGEQFSEFHFCTAQLATLDLSTGALRLVNAGHPAPLLVRDRKVVREIVAPPTLPAGLGGPVPETHVEQLQPGDTVVLYTDGVVEERGASGEQFGLDRLGDHVERVLGAGFSVPETARRLSHELMAARGGATSDDATLLVVTWLPAL